MLGFLPTRAYRPGTPGATTFLSPLSGTFNYGWDSFAEEISLLQQKCMVILKAHWLVHCIRTEEGVGNTLVAGRAPIRIKA